ncbi:hypothetical protein JOD69_002771 [Methylocaldum sp. RMAD-M]|jgi:hypothetical protein|nr:hypothetical protein [Methylocaldum sp. RMAD-M]
MHAVTLTIGLCSQRTSITAAKFFKESLIKSFDRLRTNGNVLIPFVMSLPKGMTGIHLFRASLMFHRLVLLRAAKP